MNMPASSFPARRMLALTLPFLATDRIIRARRGRPSRSAEPVDAPPLVVTARIKSALRLVAFDEAARRAGLAPGQTLAQARAMIPHLEAVEADPGADRRLLAGIADWADRYTPLVGLFGDDGLVLDITGCAHLFGGEAGLLADILGRLAAQGFAASAAIADTPGAAWAVARHGAPAVVAPGETLAALKSLPIDALRLPEAVVTGLDRLGLKRIDQIAGAPRAPLAARFGAVLLSRLDQALGTVEEAISPRRPVPALMAERFFAEPISREGDIADTLRSLAGTLAFRLSERGIGGRRFALSLYRVDGAVSRIEVGTGRPLRAPALIGELFAEKFAGLAGEEIDAGYGFDLVRLSVLTADTAAPVQIDLAGEAVGAADVDHLVDRLGARLGRSRVTRLAAGDSHVPERSWIAQPPPGAADWPEPDGPIDRPLRLLERAEPVEAVAEIPEGPPIRFRWRRVLYDVVRAEGPERIAAEWWLKEGPTRDYYRVEDRAGHRYWLYRDGLYGRETAAPRWYLQGLFG